MTVLLVGPGDRLELTLLADAVADYGSDTSVVDVTDWPGDTPVTSHPGRDETTVDVPVSLEAVTGAYVVCHELFRPYEPRHADVLETDLGPGLTQLREHRSLFESLCAQLEHRGATVVPPLDAHHVQDRKPALLDRFVRDGLPVPETVFTNDPGEVEAFADRHERIVYKPVTRGGAPHELAASDLTQERLEKLATAPVQFQAFVPGDDRRVYVVDGEVVGAFTYDTDRFSFKRDQRAGDDVTVERVSVSAEVAATARRATDLAGLQFGAVDVRRRPDGDHALFEVNEAPRFAGADEYCDLGVADALAASLT